MYGFAFKNMVIRRNKKEHMSVFQGRLNLQRYPCSHQHGPEGVVQPTGCHASGYLDIFLWALRLGKGEQEARQLGDVQSVVP